LGPERRVEAICPRRGIAPGAAALRFSLRDMRIASTICGVTKSGRIKETPDRAAWLIFPAARHELLGAPTSNGDPEANRADNERPDFCFGPMTNGRDQSNLRRYDHARAMCASRHLLPLAAAGTIGRRSFEVLQVPAIRLLRPAQRSQRSPGAAEVWGDHPPNFFASLHKDIFMSL
jgi:hypothetical protein